MEIYAELSKKQLFEIEDLETDFILPSEVQWKRKWGSRALWLECESNTKEELIDFLEDHSIPWHIVSEGSSIQKDNDQMGEKIRKKGGFKEMKDPWTKDIWGDDYAHNKDSPKKHRASF